MSDERERSELAMRNQIRTPEDVRPVARLSGVGMSLPKTQGVAAALAKLKHNMEARAENLIKRIEATDARGDDVFAKAHAHLDSAEGIIDNVHEDMDQIESAIGGNGAPSGPLES